MPMAREQHQRHHAQQQIARSPLTAAVVGCGQPHEGQVQTGERGEEPDRRGPGPSIEAWRQGHQPDGTHVPEVLARHLPGGGIPRGQRDSRDEQDRGPVTAARHGGPEAPRRRAPDDRSADEQRGRQRQGEPPNEGARPRIEPVSRHARDVRSDVGPERAAEVQKIEGGQGCDAQQEAHEKPQVGRERESIWQPVEGQEERRKKQRRLRPEQGGHRQAEPCQQMGGGRAGARPGHWAGHREHRERDERDRRRMLPELEAVEQHR